VDNPTGGIHEDTVVLQSVSNTYGHILDRHHLGIRDKINNHRQQKTHIMMIAATNHMTRNVC
jgi:hypothetical protein